jgi:hypothetical protein
MLTIAIFNRNLNSKEPAAKFNAAAKVSLRVKVRGLGNATESDLFKKSQSIFAKSERHHDRPIIRVRVYRLKKFRDIDSAAFQTRKRR